MIFTSFDAHRHAEFIGLTHAFAPASSPLLEMPHQANRYASTMTFPSLTVIYLTSITASRAPTDFMLCKIFIISLGKTPSLFNPETRSLRVAPSVKWCKDLPRLWSAKLSTKPLFFSSVSGPNFSSNWSRSSCPTLTIKFPWAIATGLMLTLSPITTVPVDSFITILAL